MLYKMLVVELPTASEDALYEACRGENCVIRTKFPEYCLGKKQDKFSKGKLPPDCPFRGPGTLDVIKQKLLRRLDNFFQKIFLP